MSKEKSNGDLPLWQKQSLKMYINGEWVESESGKTFLAYSPATGETIAELAEGTRADAQRAIRAANEARDKIRWMTAAERAAMCHRIADVMEARKEELAQMLALDQGKPYHTEALWEVGFAPNFYREAAEDILRLNGETLPSSDRNKRIITFRQPRGVYAVITPWNFPVNIPSEYLGPGLAAGNCIVWVPAPTTSVIAVKLAECLHEAGVPAGTFNLVTGPGPVVGDEIVSNPGTDAVGFTGSPVTGRRIAERAAGKPLLLELGGNGPVIVLDDADLATAVQGITFSAFLNAGQACSATERVLASDRIHDELVERTVAAARQHKLGLPFDKTTTMGPLNNEAVAAKMDRHIQDAVAKGARVLTGGARASGFPTNLFYQPTVLDQVTNEMVLNAEESFGPLVPFLKFRNYDEAIRLSNECALGLVSSVYTKNLKAAFYFAEHLRTGAVNINETPDYGESHVPYGGVSGKQSGIGRLGGKNTLMEMTDVRAMIIDLEKGGF